MKRGTTPTFTFETDIDCSQIDVLDISFSQEDRVILSKSLDDCEISGNIISLTLSEDDTLKFNCQKNPVEYQIRAYSGNAKFASDIFSTTVERILKDGCLI